MPSAKPRVATPLGLYILCSNVLYLAAAAPASLALTSTSTRHGRYTYSGRGSSYYGGSDDSDNEEVVALLILIAAICGTLIGIGVLFLFFFVCTHLAQRVRWAVFGVDEDGVSERLRNQLLPDEDSRQSYELARAFERQYPYGSINTQLTPTQETQIREKGVGAWEFVVSLDINAMLQSKTEVLFMGGENCVQTNLPVPKTNSVYYFEVKIVEKPADVNLWIGLATKPYPTWRMTGWNKYSVGYSVNNGTIHQNSPFKGIHIGEQLFVGDILGIGYQPRSGVVWFTRNGRKYKALVSGMLYDLFPTISADGPCSFSANFGQRGFVFIEANVKRWGFGPIEGTAAPPPIYGANQNTILLEAATESSQSSDDAEYSDGSSDNGQTAPACEEQHDVPGQHADVAIDVDGESASIHEPPQHDEQPALQTSAGAGMQIAPAPLSLHSPSVHSPSVHSLSPNRNSRGPYRRHGRRLRPPHYQKEDPIAAQLLEAGSTSLEPVVSYRNKQSDSLASPSSSPEAGTS